MNSKLSGTISILNATIATSSNATSLLNVMSTRISQLKKIQLAQQSLALEMTVISNKCNMYYGDDCDNNSAMTSDLLGRKYQDGTFASSCAGYRNASAPYAYNNEGSGFYLIKVDAANIFTVYCDMETMGGGWTLVMKTSSLSNYTYSNAVWTNTDISSPKTLTSITMDENYVSPAFYKLLGRESMLAMNNLKSFNTWYHNLDSARNLLL